MQQMRTVQESLVREMNQYEKSTSELRRCKNFYENYEKLVTFVKS